jgi:hypothetical protein
VVLCRQLSARRGDYRIIYQLVEEEKAIIITSSGRAPTAMNDELGSGAPVARTHEFTEGNKRTDVPLARWILDNSGLDGGGILDPADRTLANLLVEAAMGKGVESDILTFLKGQA